MQYYYVRQLYKKTKCYFVFSSSNEVTCVIYFHKGRTFIAYFFVSLLFS